MLHKRILLVVANLLCAILLYSQEVQLSGRVLTEKNEPVPFANIVVNGGEKGAVTNDNGDFTLNLKAGQSYQLSISRAGFTQLSVLLNTGKSAVQKRNFILKPIEIEGVTIEDKGRTSTMKRLDTKTVSVVPAASGDFINAVLASQPGVAMRNELSSSYSVRGGSFDENLIYVNDIEIYRPFLVRAGQQEGLSFINGDLVKSVSFSAGGFDAKYGDKLASVLDIQYKKPTRFAGSVMASLLGGSLSLENASKSGKTTYVAGFRYRSNAYLLGSLDTKGEYKPRYTDFQTYISHRINDRLDIGFLGNYSGNRFHFIPQTRETELGSIQQALRFTVYFDGQELSRYHTGMGAVDVNYRLTDDVKLKLIASHFATSEREEFDIVGQYSLDEIERDFGSDNYGKVVRNMGVGGFLNHARNKLTAEVSSVSLKTYATVLNHYLQGGVTVQREVFNDRIKEYIYLDSADYSLPQKNNGLLEVKELIRANNHLENVRVTGYVQDNYTYLNNSEDLFKVSFGVRGNYWSSGQKAVVSPRFTLAFVPNWKREINDTTSIKKNLTLRFSTGLYYQPAFYREMRNIQGQLNTDINAQQSIHFVLGADYDLRLWKRPFKLTGEAYYKLYDQLIPYEMENVRLRYYATNSAKGYARGADFKLNGEFVPGIESWASLSFLSTKEDLKNDYYYDYYNQSGQPIYSYTFDKVATDSVRHEPGYIPRPTDQLLTFSMFFQDEMPGFKGFKVNLSLIYGTALPYGPPSFERYKDTLRTPSYKRVDIGFMKELITAAKPAKGMFKHLKEAYISVEVFNLLQISNTINYTWIQAVTGANYSVPNYLTARLVNVKLITRF